MVDRNSSVISIPDRGTSPLAALGEEASGKKKKLAKACAEFESIFIYEMLKTMRRTIPKNGFIGKTAGHETYEMLMDQHVSNDLASRGGGLGLQSLLLNQLQKGK